MSDQPIKPVTPVRPIRETEEVELRRRPSFGQLRQWLTFAKRKGKERKARLAKEDGGRG